MTYRDPAAHLLPERRRLMAEWEQGHPVDVALGELDVQIAYLRLSDPQREEASP